MEVDPGDGASGSHRIEVIPGGWVEPPIVIESEPRPMRWSKVPRATNDDRSLAVEAVPAGDWPGPVARLTTRRPLDQAVVEIEWSVMWPAAQTAAIEFPVSVELGAPNERSLVLPGIHYSWEPVNEAIGGTGYGRFPRPDLRRGFAVRADRLPIVAIAVGHPLRTWVLETEGESPTPPRPDLLYSVMAYPADPATQRIGYRYPQAEWGHSEGARELAYVAKGVIGHGEDRKVRWLDGDVLVVGMRLSPSPGLPDHGLRTLTRRRWERKEVEWQGHSPALAVAAERARWSERHLWSSSLEQYESPKGSGVAMAGFVEMSLTLACVLARLADLRGIEGDEDRAQRAIGTWLDEGTTPDGAVLPIRDRTGFHAGRRRYDDPELRVSVGSETEVLRIATECRSILGLLRYRPSWLTTGTATAWRTAVVDAALWLRGRRVDGALPHVTGQDHGDRGDDGGSSSLVSLLTDLAADESSASRAASLLRVAESTYRSVVSPRAANRAFGGVTLDAACPDREAVAAALDASLAMFEATSDKSYLSDAAAAVDVLLTYVVDYQVSTFPAASDASERRISTVGASLVSPENQHLDPYPIGPLLVRYGLYSDDRPAVVAGQANTAWCLDGRWAIGTPDGMKQSEQFCHTAWHYDAYFTQRGDYRRGMPRFGLADSEHGWPQALPIAALLEQGHVTLDWPTGRVAALPGLVARVSRLEGGFGLEVTSPQGRDELVESPLLVRVLRPPRGAGLVAMRRDGIARVRWPQTLVTFAVEHAAGRLSLLLDDKA